MKRRQFVTGTSLSAGLGAILGASSVALPQLGAAQGTWPNKPITIINPFPAGGGTDAYARPLSLQLSKQLGLQVLVDNRGGAGGTIGASFAAKAVPDGHTVFMGAVHHTIAPWIYPKLDYDIERDFVPVLRVASSPQVIVVNPSRITATTLGELIKLLKANPGKFKYASAGNGTSHHLAGELFKALTQTFITHIPYSGAGSALQDLLAGGVDLMFDGLGTAAQHIRGGRIKALALASNERVSAFPTLPTAAEAGLSNYEVATWYGVWAVKGTPPEICARLHAELTKAVQAPEIKFIWEKQGAQASISSSASFAAFVKTELARWQKVVKTAGIKLD